MSENRLVGSLRSANCRDQIEHRGAAFLYALLRGAGPTHRGEIMSDIRPQSPRPERFVNYEQIAGTILSAIVGRYSSDPDGAKSYLVNFLRNYTESTQREQLGDTLIEFVFILEDLAARKKEGVAKRSKSELAALITKLKDEEGFSFGDIRIYLKDQRKMKRTTESIKKLYYRHKNRLRRPGASQWAPIIKRILDAFVHSIVNQRIRDGSICPRQFGDT
jgi:hypothetical protein